MSAIKAAGSTVCCAFLFLIMQDIPVIPTCKSSASLTANVTPFCVDAHVIFFTHLRNRNDCSSAEEESVDFGRLCVCVYVFWQTGNHNNDDIMSFVKRDSDSAKTNTLVYGLVVNVSYLPFLCFFFFVLSSEFA